MANDVGYGQANPWDFGHPTNALSFAVRQMMARMETNRLVQVQAVHYAGSGAGDIAKAGTVDVLPLVNQIDGQNNSTPHGTVYGVPWSRIQGGKNAVIIDPEVGDIGYVAVEARDISNVKRAGKQSNPGSFRMFNLSDGIYVGGVLNQVPTQYLAFAPHKIDLVDDSGNHLAFSTAGIDATPKTGQPLTIHGPEIVTGNETIQGNSAIQGNQTVTGTSDITGAFTAHSTAHVIGQSNLDGAVVAGSTMSVASNFHVAGQSALDGLVVAGGAVSVAGALSALTAQIGGGQPIKRVIFSSINASGTITAFNTIVAGTASMPGVVAGDLVILSNTFCGNFLILAAQSTTNAVSFLITNPTTSPPSPLSYSISTFILVIGVL